MKFNKYVGTFFLLSLGFISPGMAQETDEAKTAAPEDQVNFGDDTLTGDWGGKRTELHQRGIDAGFTIKADLLSNRSGGIKSGSGAMSHAEARVALDLEKLLGWDATTAYVHYHSDLGSKFNRDHVGAFVGVDNIEVATNTAQFFHAWIQKSFADDSLSLKFGLYPVDSEFYVTDTSGVFLQPPYGMANDLAQAGANGPPIFPLGALAVRAKYTTPSKSLYVMGVVSDGVPGDPNNPRGTHIQLNKGDGSLSIWEMGYTPEDDASANGDEMPETFNKTAIGIWRFTSQLPDITGAGQHSSHGAYLLAERTLFHERGHPSQGLAGFVRYGIASEQPNVADYTGSAGFRYRGLMDGRDDDIAGIAITVNHAGTPFRNSGAFDARETDYEATYRIQLKPWLAVQPTLQYIANPGFDPTLKNSVVAGIRVELEL